MEYTQIEAEVYILPYHWAGYLINGDPSGYSEDEIFEIDEFVIRNGLGFCIHVHHEPWFAHKNDSNSLGSEVTEFTFRIN